MFFLAATLEFLTMGVILITFYLDHFWPLSLTMTKTTIITVIKYRD